MFLWFGFHPSSACQLFGPVARKQAPGSDQWERFFFQGVSGRKTIWRFNDWWFFRSVMVRERERLGGQTGFHHGKGAACKGATVPHTWLLGMLDGLQILGGAEMKFPVVSPGTGRLQRTIKRDGSEHLWRLRSEVHEAGVCVEKCWKCTPRKKEEKAY